MNPLFSTSSLMILESLSFTQTLYAFDFDGTLSKIVRMPGEAKVSSKTDELLRELAGLVPVAVISGRSIHDLRERLSFQPPYLVGNHGLEGLDATNDALASAKSVCDRWKKALSVVRFDTGVEIEDKVYSLSVHYRRSRKKKKSRQYIEQVIAQLQPAPRVIRGKSVFNLLPEGAPHKGIAVLELMQKIGMKHVFYIGDDDTDEDVFSVADSRVMSVRVGKKKNSHARYFIKRQSEINQLLKKLIRYQRSLNSEKGFEA